MDPEKRFTCAQLLQHPYFDSFINEFEREKKEQLKHLHREQQKLQQQQQQAAAKSQSMAYATGGAGPNKTQTTGVSLSHSNHLSPLHAQIDLLRSILYSILFSAFSIPFSQSRS